MAKVAKEQAEYFLPAYCRKTVLRSEKYFSLKKIFTQF